MLRPTFALLLVAISVAARAEDYRATAQRLVAAQRRANLTRDAGYEERTFAPGFFTVGLQGQRFSRAQVIAERKQLLPLLSVGTDDRRIMKVAGYRNGMVVTVRARISGTIRDPRTQASHRLVSDTLSEDGWVKAGSGWKLRSQRVERYTLSIDGRRVKG